MARKFETKAIGPILLFVLHFVCAVNSKSASKLFDHAVDLDENFRLLWSIKGDDITFEAQVRTLGYVGFGFSRDNTIYGADIVIGWVDQAHVYFQDRHIKKHSNGEPVVDPTQNYVLLVGYENSTHTVLRFRRKLDTLDSAYDVPITNETMKIMFMYYNEEPKRGSVVKGSLPNPMNAFREMRPLLLTQRGSNDRNVVNNLTMTMELRNQDVMLPNYEESLHWCRYFKLTDINKKHHIVKFEPVFESAVSISYINHMILYECLDTSSEIEILSRNNGLNCRESDRLHLKCNTIVAAWTRGSEGFVFPDDVGYPIGTNGIKYYMMTTHYTHQSQYIDLSDKNRVMADNSGLKLYYTPSLRKHDAGILNVGIEPNWRHIIPPGQEAVLSEGHCVEECTRRAFPSKGINVFGVLMRTHQIGREVRLRHLRDSEEFEPIVVDSNTDSKYQEYRRFDNPVRVYPGDRLIAECTYDSSARRTITLGGFTTHEEICLAITLYYPKQKELTKCHSLPSLPTVLHSLGINSLTLGSNPVRIASPPELANMSLESRLITYDWHKNFKLFQDIQRRGSFNALCWSANNTRLENTYGDQYALNITKKWQQPRINSNVVNSNLLPATESGFVDPDEETNVIDVSWRGKMTTRSMGSESMSLSSVSSTYSMYSTKLFIFVAGLLVYSSPSIY